MVSEVQAVGKNWWLFVVLGVICVVVGILALVWPDITLLTLGVLAGVFLMVAAILEIIDAIIGDPGGRAMSAILGVIALIAGLICFRRPGETLVALVLALGIYLVAAGVIRIVRAFGDPGSRMWGLAVGGLDIVVGIVLLAWPKVGLVTVAVFFAISMLIRGLFAIVIGIKLRSVRGAEAPPEPQTATFV